MHLTIFLAAVQEAAEHTPNGVNAKSEHAEAAVKTEVADEDFDHFRIQIKSE